MLSLIAADDDKFDFYRLHSISEAWLRWERESCIERHGNHLWLLDLLGPEEDYDTYIRCGYCRAGLYDLYGDHAEFASGEIDISGKVVEIVDNLHDPHEAVEDIPVNVKLVVEEHFNPLDMMYPEYDAYLVLSSRS